MNTASFETPALPAPPAAPEADARLRQLFRHTLRDGGINPLIHLLRTHRRAAPR